MRNAQSKNIFGGGNGIFGILFGDDVFTRRVAVNHNNFFDLRDFVRVANFNFICDRRGDFVFAGFYFV